MFSIKFKKIMIVMMLVSFIGTMTPAFAVTNNTKIRTSASQTSNSSKPVNAVKLVGEVNLKHGNQLVSVSLRESDVKQVLRMFADKAGLNIVFHNSVEGTVTLDLVNVTLNNAFKMIMEASELAYYIENDTLIVTSKEADKTVGLSKSNMMVIPVKYIDATAMAEFLNKNIFGTGRAGLSNGDVAVTNPRTNEVIIFGSMNDYRVAKEVITKMDIKPSIATFKVNHVTPKEMANLICNTIFATNEDETNKIENESNSDDVDIDDQDTTLGSAGGGSSSNSSSTPLKNIKLGSGQVACKVNSEMESDTLKSINMNAVVVLYYPEHGNVGIIGGSVEQIQLIEEFIKNNDKKQPQAYVELQIIELNEDGSKQFNNNWNIWTPFFSASFDSSSGTFATNPLYPTFWAGKAYQIAGAETQITKYDGPTTITQSIQYLIKNQKGRVLANPKVVVTNGRVSTIDLSSDYVKKVNSQVMSNVMVGATSKTYDIGNDNGMTIQLVPFISADGYVSMNIKPSYSTIKEKLYSASAAGTGEQDLQATLLQRRSLNLSNVRIKDGETLVLGGLVQETETKTTTKVPLLGDIPVLGMFFRGSKNEKSKEELVILITPHIIKDTEDLQKADVVDL